MRKNSLGMTISIMSVSVGILFCSNIFAQQNKPSNVEKMQQLLDQASSQATTQFNKTYAPPRPSQSLSSTTATTPAVTPAPAEQYTPPPPPPKPRITADSSTASSSATATNSNKSPDITVNSDKAASSVGNIYAAGSSSQSSNNSGSGIKY